MNKKTNITITTRETWSTGKGVANGGGSTVFSSRSRGCRPHQRPTPAKQGAPQRGGHRGALNSSRWRRGPTWSRSATTTARPSARDMTPAP